VSTSPYAVPSGRAAQLAALREDLAAARYTTDHLADLLGKRASAALHREQRLPALRALHGSDDPAAPLVRLFVLGVVEPAVRLDAALPRTGARGLVELRLAVPGVPGMDSLGMDGPAAGSLRATCDLRPYGDEWHDWWVASDLAETVVGHVLPTDHVLGVGGASTTLASWTPRPQVARALDLGTGCGVQALHLTRHADHVTATDLSERALHYARFNAALNGMTLDLRAGSLLEPVSGEQFDLVVSNPPFVITPRRPGVPLFEYRDGGATGDSIVAGLVAELHSILAPGGITQLLGNWELGAGEQWTDRLAGWLDGTGLDAWVIQRETQDVAEYAETWVRDGGHRPGTPEFDDLYAAWLDDFTQRGVERLGFGIITLARPARERAPFRCLEELTHHVEQPAGPAVLAGLHARTWLAEHGDADLLGTRWSVAKDVTEERIGRPGAPDPMVIQLRQGGGLRRTARLDTVAAGLVGASDGELSAGQILAGVALLTEQPVDAVTAEALPMLRSLVAEGFLRDSG
jgi:hypothetical protein